MIEQSTLSFLTAEEAAGTLGISRASLYAYVSRGMIRSEPEPGTRRRRYARDDVERLAERQAQRRDPARVAERSLDWGTPVVESAITRIDDGRLFYRGHDVVELSRERSVEEVAALIWTGDFSAAARWFGAAAAGTAGRERHGEEGRREVAESDEETGGAAEDGPGGGLGDGDPHQPASGGAPGAGREAERALARL
ncbi:MAG TPA: citrate synthase, partial [Thermoanaerobaculia bacterium]|nr:citrate synthase [Thermoanaerobaculia bacterium]